MLFRGSGVAEWGVNGGLDEREVLFLAPPACEMLNCHFKCNVQFATIGYDSPVRFPRTKKSPSFLL